MTSVQHLLQQAELKAEKVSALVRAVVFVSLAVVVFSAATTNDPAGPTRFVTSIYGVGTVIGLILAWRGVFHPAIPYLFVTFDVVLVVIQVLMLSELMGMGMTSAFALPAAALIFVILTHASMRYRPWLVVYAAGLFIISIELGPWLLESDGGASMGAMRPVTHGGMAGLVNYHVLPLVLIALSTFILLVIGYRTRGLLLTSIRHATQMARLSRYFSPNLAARLADGDEDQLLTGRRQRAAVLFVDIRGFTALGETMAPPELGAFLSEYRNRLAQPVFAHGGTVDKFIGDAIMAVFGSPIERADDAARAVRCALAILDASTQWSLERERAGETPVAVGIGVHYGEVFAGALGNDQLLEYTVIGDTVNVAERLERLSREVGSSFVASAALLEAAGTIGEGVAWRRLPPQQLKGHRQPVEALCLIERGPTPPASLEGLVYCR
jgi:adenylate cyclase